jgi:outer membrane protein TolC
MKCIRLLLGILLIPAILSAQEKEVYELNLQECITYALDNQVAVQNAKLDVLSAEKRVKETVGIGLPQIDGEVNYINNFAIQTVFLPAVFFAEDPNNVPDNAPPVPVRFGVQHSGTAGITLNQLIFDGSYLIGLQASATYKELSQKALKQTKIDIVEAVSKAFYAVLVNKERYQLVENNFARTDTLLYETKIMYQNGFAEKIDVDRIQLSLNNIIAERENTKRLLAMSYIILKFQMGMDVDAELVPVGTLKEIDPQIVAATLGEVSSVEDRIEYSLLQTQRDLNILDMRNYKVANYPRLNGFVGLGYNSGTDSFNDLTQFDDWFEYGNWGLSLAVPIFSGFQRKYRIQQAKIEVAKSENNLRNMRNTIEFEVAQSKTSLENALENLEMQRENRQLATNIYEVTRVKFQQGVGSNLEVVEAETDAKNADSSYYNALYDAVVAWIDLKKALGELNVE